MAGQDDSAARLWAMAHLGTPMAIRVAATLRIADHLAAAPRTTAELAEVVDADVDALDRLLGYLAKRGLLTTDETGRYALTALAEPLRSDHPAGLRAGMDIEGIGRTELAFAQLLHSVRTGEPGYYLQFGRPFWEDLAANPTFMAAFNSYMSSDIPARSPELLSGYDWGALGHVVDVGGGDGSLIIALLTDHPSLRGTLLDQPDTARVAQAAVAAAGLTERCDVVAGSFFDPLPAGAGGYLLSLVIHDWKDDEARAILRRCAEAAGPGGRVFVIERTGADGEAPHSGMDLRMLVLFGGKERGAAELAELAAGVGLDVVAVHPAGAFSILELVVGAAAGTEID